MYGDSFFARFLDVLLEDLCFPLCVWLWVDFVTRASFWKWKNSNSFIQWTQIVSNNQNFSYLSLCINVTLSITRKLNCKNIFIEIFQRTIRFMKRSLLCSPLLSNSTSHLCPIWNKVYWNLNIVLFFSIEQTILSGYIQNI